jgi:hypothetical protein
MTPQQRRTTQTDRIGQFNGGVFKSDQPRNYPLSKSAALCVNTAFAYPYYILPILFPHKKSLGLSPAISGIMPSVMHRVIVFRITGDKYSPGFLASFFLRIPLGFTYIRALKAAEGFTRGDFTKSAAYTVAFVVIGVAGPNVVGKNKNTPYCGPRNRRDRTMLNQPDVERAAGRAPTVQCGRSRRWQTCHSARLWVFETETMTNDLARGRGPQYEQA